MKFKTLVTTVLHIIQLFMTQTIPNKLSLYDMHFFMKHISYFLWQIKWLSKDYIFCNYLVSVDYISNHCLVREYV